MTTSSLKLTGTTPAVRWRQRIEQTISLAVAQSLLDAGFSLGVNDGEEQTLQFSRDIKEVQQALFTTDEDWLLVFKAARNPSKDNRPDYWVRLIYGNDGWDVVSDYTVALEPYIGEGTAVQKLIDQFEN